MIPRWLSRFIRLFAAATDLCILGAGIIAMILTPPSIRATAGGAMATVWALLLVTGALVALVGTATKRIRVQIAGCTATAGGMAVWALAAITQTHVTLTTVGVAFAFAATSYALGWRVLGLLAGLELRREK